MSTNNLKLLHKSVVLPTLLYGVSVWVGSVRYSWCRRLLRKAQRLMTRLITRSFKNASTESPIVLSGCLPADFAAIDLAGKRHLALKSSTVAPSAAANLRKTLPGIEWSDDYEPPRHFYSSQAPPWLSNNNVKVCHKQLQSYSLSPLHANEFYVYTDGSKTRRAVGCSYIVTSKNRPWLVDHFALPPHTTVKQSEEIAILLALTAVAKLRAQPSSLVYVFTDSKAALTSIVSSGKLTTLERDIRRLLVEFSCVTFKWIPARSGVLGNEYADALARLSTNRIASPLPSYVSVPHCIANSKPIIRRIVTELWSREWSSSIKNVVCKLFFPMPDDARILHNSYIDHDLTQVLTGHCNLNAHLFKLKRVASPQCQCGEPIESVHHFVFHCVNYDAYRGDFKAQCLSDFNTYPPSFHDLTSNETIWKLFTKFIVASNRFLRS